MSIPKGMIPVEDFAKKKGLTPDKVVAMIKDGFYKGRLIDEQWYIEGSESFGANSASENKTNEPIRAQS